METVRCSQLLDENVRPDEKTVCQEFTFEWRNSPKETGVIELIFWVRKWDHR